ncbi:PREDICTED: uncharacterized protein CFAP54 [Charadrius vociferus]|uniref:uncharacterized protein CFAP54 n=1 Tax=Charadrius vociferus TaxID=50402 RepID=UPI000521B243|nr:PREDICTED: uncharacterized protein CFAP54 [Charadrius vociferus]
MVHGACETSSAASRQYLASEREKGSLTCWREVRGLAAQTPPAAQDPSGSYNPTPAPKTPCPRDEGRFHPSAAPPGAGGSAGTYAGRAYGECNCAYLFARIHAYLWMWPMSRHNTVSMRRFSHPKNSAVFIMEMRTKATWVLIPEVTGSDDPYQNSRALRTLCNVKLPVSLHTPAPFICIAAVQRANTLFKIWIKYKPRLPGWYYNEKLLKVGDSLAQIKEYKLALLQCYGRYFQQFISVNVDDIMDDVHRFKSTFFPNGLKDKNAALTIFARRGLIKIDELKQLANISSSLENSETKKIFREATLKMSVMIFKRAVYESRRKPKSYFRPKLRVNLKEAQNLPWPRTATERLLTEMFDSAAAQFLAILEALSDSSRRVLHPAPPVPDEVEIRDVISELFYAGLEILSGGKSRTGIQGGYCTDHFGIINASSTLLQLILTGEKEVSGDAAVKFIKLAFSYGEWDVFDSAIEFVVNFLQAQDDPTWKKAEMELTLLTLMQPLLFPRKFKHGFSISENNTKEARMPHGSEKKQTFRPNQAEIKFLIVDVGGQICSAVENISAVVIEMGAVTLRNVNAFLAVVCLQFKKSPTEQLQVAYESLEKAINGINTSRLMTLLPDGKSIFDNCCTKVDSNDENLNFVLGCGTDKTGTGNGFVMDLHLELIQAQHRVAVKLLKMTQGAQKDDRSLKSSKSHVKNIKGFHYLTECHLSKASPNSSPLGASLFGFDLPWTAAISKDIKVLSSEYYIFKEALTLIEQVEAEQGALYHSLKEAMSSKKKGRTPPPPLLLSRSHCSMTFKPAPFSSDTQVSWYSILGSVAGGSNMKVRLNNNKLPNAGEEIPADGKSLLEIKGLDPNEKYIFAVAAYSSDGKLIGDAIGETTKPILAYPPLSATTVRAYLTEVAYQTGNYTLAREAFSPMWDYFVSNSSLLPANAAVISASSNLTISENRLQFEAVSQTSPITLHLFLRNIFAVCDINVMEGALFCDSICSNEILYKEQVARLAECERMTAAIELSNWLNDASYTLQSVVQCYGLLAPIIYHKISSVPVVQILIKCLTVLQEIPSATLQRRQAGCYESIQHMIACTSFYTAKVEFLLYTIAACHNGFDLVIDVARGSELTGQEDPLFLYPVISCWTSNNAYREVMKFRKKSRFLEFFVQVLHKILNEEKFQCVLEWAGNVEVYLKRRNDHLLCINGISTQETSSPTLPEGTDRYTTGMAEFQKNVETSPLKKPEASTLKKPRKEALSPIRRRQTLRQYFMKHPDVMVSPEARRKCKEELQKVARHTLVVLLQPIVSNYLNRKKFHQICLEEMPWRSQMNIYLAVAHYNLFKKKLEEQYNIGICGSWRLDRYNILDPEIFSLNNSGTVVVREAAENNTRTPTPPLLKKSGMTEKQTCTDKSSEHSIKLSGTDTTATQMTNNTEISVSPSPKEYNQFLSNTILLEHFTKIFLHLRRAVVLAHRGGHWTLLQNACRELWNYTQELQLIAHHSRSHTDAFPITRCFLRDTIWLPFYLASDMIIDMIIELQASRSLKIVDPKGDFCIPSCLGGITDENGGSNLHPLSPLDDVNVVDLKWTCNLILKTIELLYQMKKWEALVHIAVQFNIFTQVAFEYWCQALDETLNIPDALNHWQELGFPKNATDCFAVERSTDISQKFLSQAGVWGCLHAAVLVAKIAQYITTSNMRLRTKYCYFSAILFKALFRASLPHPMSDCDFAQYETNMLIPGIDLFSDRYRADISTVVASLNFLMFELHCAKQNLIILPLFTLYQYIVSEICKDPAKCIEGRIFKIKVLTDIGFFMEAFHELSLLNCGERIPWKIPAGYRKIEQMKDLQKFDSSKSLLTVTNLQVLEDIFNGSLSLTMVPLCNEQIMNKLTLAKMHFIICLSATINNIPEKVEKHIYSVDNNSLKEPSRITASNVKGDADKNSRQQEQRGKMVQLVDCKDELNMAMLKGILLTEAEESLSHLVQNIQDKYDGEISRCSAEDLEAVIEAKLQLAAISQQRHQAAFTVALAFSAIRLLQDAKIFRIEVTHFQEEKDERECLDSYVEDVQLPHSITAQDHLNVHLWLRCRTMLVTALVTQIHGVGNMKENDMAERRSVIKEVILEAEAFGDTETQAEMMVQAAILDLQEKRPVAGIKLLLENIISLLQEDTFISPPASLTLVKSMLLLADILTLQRVEDTKHCSSTVEPLNLLTLAHELTIKAIFVCGEPIELQIEDSTLTCLALPTKNIYLPHINLLAQVKMRIGHTLAEKVACIPERGDPLQWLCALKHFESALKLCRASATKKLDMEAELLFQIGKVERQITEAGNDKSSRAAETLLEAIKLSQQHDQKFELIRRSYLEIALLYLHFATNNEDVSQTDKIVPSKSNTSSGELSSPEEALKSEGYKVQAWIAVSLEITGITSKMTHVRIASPVSVMREVDSQMDSRAANASNKEINIQWYIPSLAKPSNDADTKVLLLYAYNTKPVKIGNIKIFSSKSTFSGHLWIPLTRIISLREKLSNLKEQVEMLMQSSKSLSSASEPTSFLEQSESLKIIHSKKPKVNVTKVHLDEKTEIPFDVTLQSIASLEDMFDPANGCTISEESLFNWIISLFH